jgi:ABC-type polysaccharide/polyol phosphate transport system ATPase subunit
MANVRLEEIKEHGLNKIQNFILSLASLSFIRRGIEGEVVCSLILIPKCRFNNVAAIEDITFAIGNGEFWVLVGSWGWGKSIILRAIADLETSTSGKLLIGDRFL